MIHEYITMNVLTCVHSVDMATTVPSPHGRLMAAFSGYSMELLDDKVSRD